MKQGEYSSLRSGGGRESLLRWLDQRGLDWPWRFTMSHYTRIKEPFEGLLRNIVPVHSGVNLHCERAGSF